MKQNVNIFIIIIVLRYNHLTKIIKTPRTVFSYSNSKKHLNTIKPDFLRQNIFYILFMLSVHNLYIIPKYNTHLNQSFPYLNLT